MQLFRYHIFCVVQTNFIRITDVWTEKDNSAKKLNFTKFFQISNLFQFSIVKSMFLYPPLLFKYKHIFQFTRKLMKRKYLGQIKRKRERERVRETSKIKSINQIDRQNSNHSRVLFVYFPFRWYCLMCHPRITNYAQVVLPYNGSLKREKANTRKSIINLKQNFWRIFLTSSLSRYSQFTGAAYFSIKSNSFTVIVVAKSVDYIFG